MAKHTPGPFFKSWSPDYVKREARVIRAQHPRSGLVVAVLTNLPDREANAALFEAAPDLLAILRAIADSGLLDDPDTGGPRFAARARAAIARADGH